MKKTSRVMKWMTRAANRGIVYIYAEGSTLQFDSRSRFPTNIQSSRRLKGATCIQVSTVVQVRDLELQNPTNHPTLIYQLDL